MANSNSAPRQLRKPILGLALAAASIVTLSACSSGYADTDTGSTATFQEESQGRLFFTQIDKDGKVSQFGISPTDDNNHDDDEAIFNDVADGKLVDEADVNPEAIHSPRAGELSDDETTVLWNDGETSSVQINDDTLILDDETIQSFDSDASVAFQEESGYTR